jgi:hypothetical protein
VTVSDDEYAFRMTNNDTSPHSIQLGVPGTGVPIVGTFEQGGGPNPSTLSFENVGPGEYITVYFTVITGDGTAGKVLSGELSVSAGESTDSTPTPPLE